MKVIKLAISKYEKNSDEYKIYENEMKRIDNITYNILGIFLQNVLKKYKHVSEAINIFKATITDTTK